MGCSGRGAISCLKSSRLHKNWRGNGWRLTVIDLFYIAYNDDIVMPYRKAGTIKISFHPLCKVSCFYNIQELNE